MWERWFVEWVVGGEEDEFCGEVLLAAWLGFEVGFLVRMLFFRSPTKHP